MNFMKQIRRPMAAMTLSALLVACASPTGPGGTAAVDDPCNVGQSALAGALLGAVIGGMLGDKESAIKGAIGGAALAAVGCVAINSKQVKTAAEVERDYLRTNPVLPTQPRVTSYVARINTPSAKRGEPIRISSELELVNGSLQKVSDVREELVILDPRGEPIKAGGKPFTSSIAGRFANSFELTLPSNARQGVYSMRTNVFLNGAHVATRNLQTQVVWNGETTVITAAR